MFKLTRTPSPFVPSPSTARRAGAQDKLLPSAEVEGFGRAKPRPLCVCGSRLRSNWPLDFARGERVVFENVGGRSCN